MERGENEGGRISIGEFTGGELVKVGRNAGG